MIAHLNNFYVLCRVFMWSRQCWSIGAWNASRKLLASKWSFPQTFQMMCGQRKTQRQSSERWRTQHATSQPLERSPKRSKIFRFWTENLSLNCRLRRCSNQRSPRCCPSGSPASTTKKSSRAASSTRCGRCSLSWRTSCMTCQLVRRRTRYTKWFRLQIRPTLIPLPSRTRRRS